MSKIIANLVSFFDFCSFTLENVLEHSENFLEQWDEVNEKISKMKSQIDSLLNIIGTVSQSTDMDSGA